jgi:hypothetical protein
MAPRYSQQIATLVAEDRANRLEIGFVRRRPVPGRRIEKKGGGAPRADRHRRDRGGWSCTALVAPGCESVALGGGSSWGWLRRLD